MTYCLAIKLTDGLVFASDSRTNAGVDDVGAYSKMHTFGCSGNRMFVLLSAGNLATTQAVVKRLHADCQMVEHFSLFTAPDIDSAASYVGRLSAEIQRSQAQLDPTDSSFEATFLFGGEISGSPPAIFLIYPQGNYIHESPDHPFLQIGETKYGKPILDRVIRRDTPVELAARCAFVSINSTIRSNLTVGAPVELLLYWSGSLNSGRRIVLHETDPFYQAIQDGWNEGLRQALNNLPAFEWERQQRTVQAVQGEAIEFPGPGSSCPGL